MTWADDLAKLKAIEDLDPRVMFDTEYAEKVQKILAGEVEPLPKEPGNVRTLHNLTFLDIPPDRVLRAGMGNMSAVLLLGWDNDDLLYAVSSIRDGGDILWLMEAARQRLFRATDDEGVF